MDNHQLGAAGELLEVENLRLRLAEAESLLHAIAHYEVDAFVVQGPQGEQVFTLKGAEHTYRVIVESINEGAVTVGPDSLIYYGNHAFANLLKCPLKQVIGALLVDFVAHADRALYAHLIERGLREGSKGEIRLLAADGREVPVLLSCSSLRLDTVEGVCIVATDLTEQKRQAEVLLQTTLRLQQETALREREELFSATFEQAAVGLAHIDLQGRYLRVNQRICELTGYPREELLGRNYEEITYPGDLAADRNYRQAMIDRTIKGVRFEKRYVRYDGALVWAQVTGSLVSDSMSGEPKYFISVVEDISERKAQEARLLLLAELSDVLSATTFDERKLQSVAELLVPRLADWCAICLLTAAGTLGGLAVAHAVSGDAAPLRACLETLSQHADYMGALAAALETGKPLLLPHIANPSNAFDELMVKLQPFGLASLLLVPLQVGEQTFGAVVVVRADDVQPYTATIQSFIVELVERLALSLENARLYRAARSAEVELRHLNETLEDRVAARTAELERSNRELDRFAYVASHDLKAPLRAIDSLAKWIASDAEAILPQASKEHLAKLRGRVGRMERLLNDLLTYSRAGRVQHDTERVDTGALVRSTFELLAPPAGFTLVVREPMTSFVTQRVPLETVLRNLIGNAIKHHTRHNGMVSVSAVEQDDRFVFTVADDGPGIAPEYHERIFDMFQTLLPRDQVEGSGMGLAIVKKTVEALGGRVTLDSAPAQGARFSFTWPRHIPPG